MQMSEKIDDDRIVKLIHANKLTSSISKKHSTPERKITRRREKSINILTITSYYLLSTGLSRARQMYFFLPFLPSAPLSASSQLGPVSAVSLNQQA
ncbi:hypothetical protein J3E69DRAFT_328754 [Trichoderma sp. SZMC 28015]